MSPYRTKYPIQDRHVRIHPYEVSHMHDTPYTAHTDKWVVQFEVQGSWKSRSMGWMFFDDEYSIRDKHFSSLQQAVKFCKDNGVSFQLELPKKRKLIFKSYAHNFLWKGEPEIQSEDIEN